MRVVLLQRKYDEARSLYDRAIQTWEKNGDPKLVDAVTSKADMYMQQVRDSEHRGIICYERLQAQLLSVPVCTELSRGAATIVLQSVLTYHVDLDYR